MLYLGTPKYIPNKRLKKNGAFSFYKSKIELVDKLDKSYYEFRVFKENDLCYNQHIQSTLRDTVLIYF